MEAPEFDDDKDALDVGDDFDIDDDSDEEEGPDS